MPPATAIAWPDLAQGPQLVALAEELGDFVVRKKDGVAAYQVASVLDDQRLGVNFIVRGQDLRASTAAQLWLAGWLPAHAGFTQTRFLHHGLLLDDTGQKLSKSTQTSQQRGMLAEATAPQVVYRAVAALLGLPAGAGESLATLRAALPTSAPS
ncbi:glutamate--tRNA ligase family protein [Hymenobacter lapidiphilus]|uniref:glutamate--tRNA ligase family protein n=1 Tax=Hymenobacter sp. CCM 8763 TaxID=2303334 RepID=UPI00167DA463|nr:glutamate--tRNA ligase family protein [Hymenobacter sp. CCM 8763]